jgi:hypothetical protein
VVLGRLLAEQDIDFLNGPPALLNRIPAAPYPRLRCLVAGGEAFAQELVERWTAPGRQFVNGYGPTEAAVGCVSFECIPTDGWSSPSPPIGRPMPNRVAYVLDDTNNPVPPGVSGEIVVGGDGLARGYLGSPALTAQRFIPDPFHPGRRMYRTGDLGTWTEQGRIQYLGRADSQVKVNGLRIELEEVDSILVRHPGVREAATVVATHPDGGRSLAAYLCGDGPAPSALELREHLARTLPLFMIPRSFTFVPELPLTKAGKTDRGALTRLAGTDPAAAVFVPPRTPVERQVLGVLTEALGRPVGVRDDLFTGADRATVAVLVADRLAARLRIDLPAIEVYGCGSAEQLCDLVREAVHGGGAGAAAVDDEDLLARVESMSDAELRELARQLDATEPAG